MKNKIYLIVITFLISVFVFQFLSWFHNPDLTYIEVFKSTWHWTLLNCIISTLVLLFLDNNRKKYLIQVGKKAHGRTFGKNNFKEFDKKESILCAAIWYKEIPLVRPEAVKGRGTNPTNVDKGIVICGWRHGNCILTKSAITGLRDAECGEFEQGFLTNLNRFVDRKEGGQIAFTAKQTEELKTYLFSEDLY